MPKCARCGEDGAGLRYQAWWFCAKCWTDVRGHAAYGPEWFTRWGLTSDGVKAEDRDAETSATTLAPADSPHNACYEQASSRRALPTLRGGALLAQDETFSEGHAPTVSADHGRAGRPGV